MDERYIQHWGAHCQHMKSCTVLKVLRTCDFMLQHDTSEPEKVLRCRCPQQLAFVNNCISQNLWPPPVSQHQLLITALCCKTHIGAA